jgi:DNA-binding PadR family transcriptional regulator
MELPENEPLANMIIEIRRGTLPLAVLSQLKTPQYGYSLLQSLEGKSVNVEAHTLYPMLRRLEQQNLLRSDWDTTESRPRKYYVLSEAGLKVFEELKAAWLRLSGEMLALFMEEEKS